MKTKQSFTWKACLFFILIFFNLNSFSQAMKYAYDAAGNRVKKELVFADDEEDPEPGLRKKVVLEDILSEELIKIYPNPTEGLLKIELSKDLVDNSKFRLITLTGKVILEKKATNLIVELDFREQANGNYILQLINEDDISNWKIIKK